MTPLLSAWVAEIVLIAYRGAKAGTAKTNPIPGLALPSDYASTFIIYGALAFVPGEGQRVAAAIGWGFVVATFLNLWNPGTTAKGAAPGTTVMPFASDQPAAGPHPATKGQ